MRHTALMYTLRVHTWPHHHVVLTVCFSLDDHVRGSSDTVLLNRALYSTVTSPVFPGLALCSLNTCRQHAPSPPPSFLNLPCSLPSNLIPLILSPHVVCFFFFLDADIYHSIALHPSYTLELQPIPFSPVLNHFFRGDVGSGLKDGQIMRAEEKGGEKHSWAESFHSLFLLRPPLIDGLHGTS